MKIIDILSAINATIYTEKKLTEQTFQGIYACDLVSNIMAKINEGQMLITIICNINTIAVATLRDIPVVCFSEDVIPTKEMVEKANQEKICLISSPLSTVDIIRSVDKL